jgi:Family of unknown function (DUF6152)
MKYRISVSIALAIWLAAGTAWAHHNMSALFDFNQRFERTGTLTKLDWRNPHSYITVEAKDDQDQMETWLFEGPAPNVFRNLNVGKADFESALNKTVKVEASRARDGSLKGLMRILTFPDGKIVSLCPQNC